MPRAPARSSRTSWLGQHAEATRVSSRGGHVPRHRVAVEIACRRVDVVPADADLRHRPGGGGERPRVKRPFRRHGQPRRRGHVIGREDHVEVEAARRVLLDRAGKVVSIGLDRTHV